MNVSAYLIHIPSGEAVRHANVHADTFTTPRALIYRVKRALGVSHYRHAVKETGEGLTIHLHGSNVCIEAERQETL